MDESKGAGQRVYVTWKRLELGPVRRVDDDDCEDEEHQYRDAEEHGNG